MYGDTVYFKIPFEYENVYAADIFLTYSDNLEFKDADCGTDGEKAVRFAVWYRERRGKTRRNGQAFCLMSS